MDPAWNINTIFAKIKTGTIQNMCIICFENRTYQNNSTTQNTEDETCSYIYWYEALTSVTYIKDEMLPSSFCDRCLKELESCFKFRQKCIKAAEKLKDVLKQINDQRNKPYSVKNEILPISKPKNVLDANKSKQNIIKDECDEYDIEYLDEFINDPYETASFEELSHKEEDGVKPATNLLPSSKLSGKKHAQKRNKNHNKAHSIESGEEINTGNKCPSCKKVFQSADDLNVHMSLHMQGRRWVCNACGKEYKDKATLRRHIVRHMSVRRYKCDICSKSFCERSELKKHMRVHTGEVVPKKKTVRKTAPLSCSVCGAEFGSRRLLESHRRRHDDNKPYHCPHCDKRFRHDSTLTSHIRTHTGEKPYVCSFCGKSFIQSTNLRLHTRTHTGEKPYSCRHCPKKFSSGSTLKNHLRTHSKDAIFKCEVCDKKLAPGSQSSHRRVHGRGPRAGCPVCHKSFATGAVLREHTLLHTGEKPFECKTCSVKYPTKTRLDRHNRLKHGKKLTSKPQEEHESVIDKDGETVKFLGEVKIYDSANNHDVNTEISHMPLEVSRELVLQADGETKEELVGDGSYQNEEICLPQDCKYGIDNVLLMTVKDDGVEISEMKVAGDGSIEVVQIDRSITTL